MTKEAIDRLVRLQSYLDADPDNLNLLCDVADAAIVAGDIQTAHECFEKIGDCASVGDDVRSNAGLAAIQSGYPSRAIEHFQALLERHPDDLGLRYNLAFAYSMLGNHSEAFKLLNAELTEKLPQAAMLKLQIAHQNADFEDATEMMRVFVDAHPDYGPLMAVASVLAIDVNDEDLAKRCAEAAGDHPDALTTLATLKLGDQDIEGANALFEKAIGLERSPQPRALIGLGLAAMAAGDMAKASNYIDRGAAAFQDHLGSWIAAGWAYLLAGDRQTARQRFQRSLDLDASFAESHGSLAVIDLMEGDTDMAERRMEVASRLDRNSFSSALAQSMVQEAAGDPDKAARILKIAMEQPIDGGRTIAETLAMRSLRG